MTVEKFFQDSDVHITLEDQKKINYFARFNAKHDDIKAELKSKQVSEQFEKITFTNWKK